MSSVTEVKRKIMEAIATGAFGEKLPPQDTLAVNYKVSRTALREALVQIESSSVIDIRPKTGTRIVEPSKWTLVNPGMADWYFVARPETAASEAVELMTAIVNTVVWTVRHASGLGRRLTALLDTELAPQVGSYQKFYKELLDASGNFFFKQQAPIINALLTVKVGSMSVDDLSLFHNAHWDLVRLLDSVDMTKYKLETALLNITNHLI